VTQQSTFKAVLTTRKYVHIFRGIETRNCKMSKFQVQMGIHMSNGMIARLYGYG